MGSKRGDQPMFALRHKLMTSVAAAAVFAISGTAQAGVPITGTQLQSNVGTTVNPDFQGGTLRDDQNNVKDNHDYLVENFPGNTIDAFGDVTTFAGSFSGAGPLTITDSIGGGNVIFTGGNVIGGTVTINSGATMQWGNGSGGAFLVGGGNAVTDNGALVMDFGGGGIAGSVPISGSGTLELKSGSFSESGAATYTGTTTIDPAGDLLLTGAGSIGSSSDVIVNGTFDISGTGAGASITTLDGAGSVLLGGQTLTLTNASGLFSGVIADGGAFGGTGGGLTIGGGTETLTGTNTFTGPTTIAGAATLVLGNGGTTGSVAGNIVDNGLLNFDYGAPVTVSKSISGTGSAEVVAGTAVVTGASAIGGTVTIDSGATMQWGSGNPGFLVGGGNAVTDNGALVMDFGGGGIAGSVPISGTGTVELKSGSFNESGASTYTGTTTIDAAGDLLLSGAGSIGSSSDVIVNGTFDISGTAGGTSITTLDGAGGVSLGAQTLTLTNASGLFSGVIADGGAFGGTGGGLTIGGGTETLTGTNTFTGPTTINGGATLVLGNGGTTGSVAGNILDNGLLQFNYGAPVTMGNSVAGAGSAEVVAGTLVVTGASAIGGAVTIDSGATMQWGSGNPGFLVGGGNAVVDNGALVMDFGGGGIAGSVPISGSGTLELKSGSFNESGAATYTGTTTIDAPGDLLLSGAGSIGSSSDVIINGTFDISGTAAGTSITTLDGAGGVSLGAQTLTLTNASGLFSGVIADGGAFGGTGGGLTIGGGTETLTGTNTFTGPTTIAGGATLVLGNGGTTGTVAGNIVDNGLVKFDYGGPVITGNSFSGTGSAEVAAGTVVITGASAIGGTVTIDSGATMQWGSGGPAFLVGGGNAVVDNGALVMAFGSGGIGGSVPISGSGTVELKSGSFNESGASTYTGTTTIDSGSLFLLSGTGSIANSDVIDNGTFDISGTTAGTSIGSLDGSGGVSLGAQTLTLNTASGLFSGVIADGGLFGGTGGGLTIGGGTETLTGTNTFTGPTTINGGATLVLGNGGTTGSVAGNIVDNGLLKFNYGGPVTFANSLAGSGSAELVAGALTMSGTSNIGGAFTIDSGLLNLTGSLTSATSNVHSGATLNLASSGILTSALTNNGLLKGTGHIIGSVLNNGTISPGASPGIITITGSFTQSATGVLVEDITPVAIPGVGFDQIIVNGVPGTASLNGTLAVNAVFGQYVAGTNYDIIDALGGITGNFATITGVTISPFISLDPVGVVTISGTEQVYRLTIVRTPFAVAIAPGATPNQIAVATGFQGLLTPVPTGDAAALTFAVDSMTLDQARAFFDQASPEPYGAYGRALLNQGELFSRQIALQENETPNVLPGPDIWMRGYGAWGKSRNDSFRFGSNVDSWGLAGGLTYRWSGFWLGAAGGWSNDKVHYSLGNSDGHEKSWQAGLYGGWQGGPWNADFQLDYAHGSVNASRSIDVATVIRQAHASTSGHLWKFIGTAGYDFDLGFGALRPFVGFDYTSGKLDGFTETGAGAANLTVGSIDAKRFDGMIGLDLKANPNSSISPYGRLVWRHNFNKQHDEIHAIFNGEPDTAFTVSAVTPAKNEVDADLGINFQVNPSLAIYAGYEGSFRKDLHQNGFSAGLSYSFGAPPPPPAPISAPPPPPPPPPPPAVQTCPNGSVIPATETCPPPPPPAAPERGG